MTPTDLAAFNVGRWMLAATALGALLAMAAWSIERLRRLAGQSTRGAWAFALAAAVAWPFAAALWTSAPTAEVRTVASLGVAVATPLTTEPSQTDRVVAWWAQHGSGTLLAIWLWASMLLCAHTLRALWQLHRAARAAHQTELQGHRVLVSESLGPAAFGVWRPRVVIPRWVLELDDSLQALVLRHEREHCHGRDAWLVWLAVLGTMLVPWNLAVWSLASRLRLAMEVDCDARTLRAFPERRTAYARLLLLIAQRAMPVRIAPALAHWPSHLSRRIAAMSTNAVSRPSLHRAMAGVVLVAATAGACSRTVAGNLAGPVPAMRPSQAASSAAIPDTTADRMPVAGPDTSVERAMPVAGTVAASPPAYFDFQVEKPATMKAGSAGPTYPAGLRAARVEGTVVAQYIVGTDGRVDLTTFKAPKSDHPEFTAAVREALARMRYEPAMVGGMAVKQLVQQPFMFALSTGEPTSSASTPTAPVPPAASESRPPRLRAGSPGPRYPAALRAAKIEGSVLAQFVVDIDGRVDMTTFKVLKSEGEAFTAAVREGVPTMQFEPALANGKPVRHLMQLPFSFALDR